MPRSARTRASSVLAATSSASFKRRFATLPPRCWRSLEPGRSFHEFECDPDRAAAAVDAKGDGHGAHDRVHMLDKVGRAFNVGARPDQQASHPYIGFTLFDLAGILESALEACAD